MADPADASEKLRRRFAQFTVAQRGRLVAAARRILGDHHEAEDVVQQTLAILWQRVDRLPLRIEAYAYKAVQFNALKRRARRKLHRPLDDQIHSAVRAENPDEENLDPLALEQALMDLPVTQQTVLRMKYYMNMTFREIGVTLSISAHTAASRCRYGLQRLRKTLNSSGGPKTSNKTHEGR